ncbi:MAG: hypothetical protein WCX65_15725 [bacterium]
MKKSIFRTIGAAAAGAAMLFTLATFASAQAAKTGAAPAGKPGAKGPQISAEQQKNMIGMVNEKLKHRFTPSIKSVVIGPASVGKPVKVTIKASYDDKRAIDKIVEASVYYSLDGGNSFIGPVKLNAAGAGTWAGNIPGIKKAGKALLYPRVKDSFGNVAIHLPCKVSAEWPPFGDGCMVPGAIGPEQRKPTEIIEDNFKILDLRIGMDDKYFYIDQSVEGNIKKGTMNPTHINAYMAMIVDAKELNEFNDAAVLMSPEAKDKFKDKANLAFPIIYAPLASAAAGSMAESAKPADGAKAAKPADKKEAAAKPAAPPKVPSCMVPRQINGKTEMDSKSVKCKADGPDLFIRFDRSIMPPSMKDTFILLGALNGFIDNMQAPIPKIREVTGFTRVSFKQYSFAVK